MRVVKNGDIHVSVPYGMPHERVKEFIEKNKAWIETARAKNDALQSRRFKFFSQLPLETKEQECDAIGRLDAKVRPLVQRYSGLMKVKPSHVGYRATVSRWGMCDARTRDIYFSVYLLLLPDWCIEHVVVHELAHLLEPNHSPGFYAIMNRFYPQWKEARAEMRRVTKMETEQV